MGAAAVLLSTASLIMITPLGAQDSEGKIWQGVYTDAQAERGKEYFHKGECAGCHRLDLMGGGGDNTTMGGPSLKGDRFLNEWEDKDVNMLFSFVRDNMPKLANALITTEQKIDVVAYILKENGFPAGSKDLTMNPEELQQISFVRKGERGPNNFMLVRVVGCLGRGDDKSWILTRATDPMVTPDQSTTADALQQAKAGKMGSATFRLVSVVPSFHAETRLGQKIEARGLLYKDASPNLLNLTSLEAVGSACTD
jgi:mono/diheme cytochrome c family protein